MCAREKFAKVAGEKRKARPTEVTANEPHASKFAAQLRPASEPLRKLPNVILGVVVPHTFVCFFSPPISGHMIHNQYFRYAAALCLPQTDNLRCNSVSNKRAEGCLHSLTLTHSLTLSRALCFSFSH